MNAPRASNESSNYCWSQAAAEMQREEQERQEQERQEQERYAVALANARAKIENCALSRKAYGPFMEAMIIAHAKCDLKFPRSSKEWWNELEKHEVIHEYRGWCFSKMPGSISAGW